jgi:hypothetical protein
VHPKYLFWNRILLDFKIEVLTINVPLFLEVRDFMFFMREKHIISHFAGFFEGAKTFLTSKFRHQKSRGPLKNPKKWLGYVFFPTKKHKIPNF